MSSSSMMFMGSLAIVAALGAGCSTPEPPAKPPVAPVATPRAVPPPDKKTEKEPVGVAVSDDLKKACNIQFGAIDQAPKFDFDRSEVLASDQAILEQVATCVKTGPLAGKSLMLVGHADPRGELDYNFALGQRRAGSVRTFLTNLGVAADKISTTSRGALDATGKDEDGWRRDRRVDVQLGT